MQQIYLVDDDDNFRETAAIWLDALGYQVVAFSDPADFLDDVSATAADKAAVLLDIRMPQMSGLQVIRHLNDQKIHMPIIFITGHGDVPLAVEAMREGAVTFLEKPLDAAALSNALSQAFSTLDQERDGNDTYQSRLAELTQREREIFDNVTAGKKNKAIAEDLDISIKTVEFHRKRMMKKLGANSYSELIRMSVEKTVQEATS